MQILRRQKRHKRVLTSTSASAPSTGQHSQSLSIDKDASKAVLLCSDQYHYTDANGSSEKPRFAISRDRFCKDEVEMIEFEFGPLPPLLFDSNGANDIQGTFTILSAVLK